MVMESTSTASRAEVLKPVLLKAGIPFVLSVAGFVYARIIAKKSINPRTTSLQTQVSSTESDYHGDDHRNGDSLNGFDSTSSAYKEDEEQIITATHFVNSVESSDIEDDQHSFDQEILGLRGQIEELGRRERELDMQFYRYCTMKEQEIVLIKLRSMLLLEIARFEFLDREILSMEAENQRLENLVTEYLRQLEQLERANLENGSRQRKLRKLQRKTEEQSSSIREKDLKIEAREAEILRSHEVLETKTNAIRCLEDEVRMLQTTIDQMQGEKTELLKRLSLAENSVPSNSKFEAEVVTMEDYNQIVNELEQLQKDRAAESKELIQLRWCNACLRHELMRNHEQQKQIEENKNHLGLEFEEIGGCSMENQVDGSVLGHDEPCGGVATRGQASSRKHKFLRKLRRWVEGGDNNTKPGKLDEIEKHEIKCLGRLSVSDGTEGHPGQEARKSYSSA